MDIALDFVLETPRCTLRPPSHDDIPRVFSASRFPGFNDGMTWDPPETVEELQAPLERNLAAWRAGTAYTFAIETKQLQPAFVGRIVIRQTEGDRLWNFGFWTHPAQQGKGYMTEAATAVVGFGFTQLGAEHIAACHALWNLKSRRVLEKVGMTFVKHVPQGFQKNGVWVAEDCLGVSRDS